MVASEQAPAASEAGAFGRLLRHYREGAGLAQERLAERAGLSAPAISNLERGVNRPRLETITLLAAALSLTAEQRDALVLAARPSQTTAPAAPSVGAARSPLPLPPTPLVGREHDIAAVRARLAEPEGRMLTLVGVGGVGKTRLALAVGASVQDDAAGAVRLVELAALGDPALLPQTVAAALGVREDPHGSLLDTLVAALRGQPVLLVLDNCEHLLAACATLVPTLLQASPGVRVLATSREGLGVRGEQLYRVPPLPVPDPQPVVSLAYVRNSPAVRLFVARVQARRPFELTEQSAPLVAELCRRLDGLPLAIELAAARADGLGLAAIVQRLDERFRLLTGGPRDVLPRQQTLRATLDWSWELLAAPEQALLERLTVFIGGWTLEAAELVCAEPARGLDGWAVLEGLAGLVHKSLVEVDEAGAGARYRLLETVRQYAAERLATHARGVETVWERHLAWCVALAEEAEPHLGGAEQDRWLARLEADYENLRAALHWAQERGRHEAGLRLVAALWRFWNMRGQLSEGRGWLEAALAPDHGPPAVRANALDGAGVLAFQQGDFAHAVTLHEQSLALRRTLGDQRGIAAALTNLGHVTAEQGDYARAVSVYEESLALHRALGDQRGVATALSALGIVADLQGDYGRARELHEEGLALRRALGDRQAIAKSLNNLGIVAKKQGDYTRAVALYAESLTLHRAVGDTHGLAHALGNLGVATYLQGDLGRAATVLEESLALERELEDTQGIAHALGDLGVVAYLQGDLGQAAVLHEESLALQRTLGDKHGIAVSLGSLGIVAYQQGRVARAAALFTEALLLSRELGAMDLVAQGLEGCAWIAGAQGQPRPAAHLLGAAAALRETLGMPLLSEQSTGHEQTLRALHAALGEERVGAAYAEGRALSVEDAATLAPQLPIAAE